MRPSPGRAVRDKAGDRRTSGAGGSMTRGMGRGSSSPSASAIGLASSSETFRSMDTVRSRIAGTWTLVSSKRKARMMWAFSCGIWLFQKRVAWE
jgi:hypothetical protein